MRTLAPEEIAAAFDAVRAGGALSNWVGQRPSTPREGTIGDRWALFLEPDEGFSRLVFVARDAAAFDEAAAALPARGVVVDLVGAPPDPAAASALAGAGFRLHATYRRYTCARLPVRAPRVSVAHADIAEVDEIHALLRVGFDPLADHLPTRADLAALVDAGQVIVHRGPSGVDGLAVYRLQGRRGNLNYWYSAPTAGPLVALGLLLDFYHDLATRDVRAALLWVDDAKPAVAQTHSRYGYAPDGAIDQIFVR